MSGNSRSLQPQANPTAAIVAMVGKAGGDLKVSTLQHYCAAIGQKFALTL